MTTIRGQAAPAGIDTTNSDPHDQNFVVSFDDNRIVQDLLGEYDANIAMLEDKLGVEAIIHGNVITLKGPEDTCNAAKSILQELYERSARGETIGRDEIDSAIRHAGIPLKPNRRTKVEAEKAAEDKDRPKTAARIATRKKNITARTPLQSEYIRAMGAKELIFATGPAGTGKTYLAVAHAASLLERGEAERIILSRPAVEAGERLGFLPGDMRDKVDPYLRPLYDALYDVLPPERVEKGMESGVIEIAPLAFMRGRTLANAIIILDEAQNCTSMQMKMFLTRHGENSKMVVTGDPSQIDLPAGQSSGLCEAITLLQNIDSIGHIAFTGSDVVRSELVAAIVKAYDKAN